MTRHVRFIARLTAAFVLAGVALLQGAAAQETARLSGQPLVDALRQGGYNIYFRHAATDWSQDDNVAKAGDWTSCDPQKMRQLSAGGRQVARSIGEAMHALRIPVGSVLASPYCRTVETARLMDLGPVETTTDVMNTLAASFVGGVPAIAERARTRLATAPPAGTNTVLVAHGNVLLAAAGVHPKEAEAVVFRPDGGGGYAVTARVTPKEWTRLAAVFAERR